MLDDVDAYLGLNLPENHGDKINIYKGDITIFKDDIRINIKEGEVFLALYPKPSIYFKGQVEKLLKPEVLGQYFTLTINNYLPTKVLICNINFSSRNGQSISGVIIDTLEKPMQEIDKYYFYIVNFIDTLGRPIKYNNLFYLGRICFSYRDWEITVDKKSNAKEIFDFLKNNNGYAVTHIGVIKRKNNEKFYQKDIEFLLEAIFWVFSFAAGRYVGLDIQYGYKENDIVWERYCDYRVSPWDKEKITWFSSRHTNILEDVLKCFISKFEDPLWKRPLISSIEWYINSLGNSLLEGYIIWIEAALELLSWIRFTQENNVLTDEGFDRLLASDKIRLLLHDCNIPSGLPFELGKSMKIQSNKLDGPYIFTEMRNCIVHPKKIEKIEDFTIDDKWKIFNLGLWYLELAILNIIGYKGLYQNRLRLFSEGLWIGQIEKVPWDK
jgi:hypothetical protein